MADALFVVFYEKRDRDIETELCSMRLPDYPRKGDIVKLYDIIKGSSVAYFIVQSTRFNIGTTKLMDSVSYYADVTVILKRSNKYCQDKD